MSFDRKHLDHSFRAKWFTIHVLSNLSSIINDRAVTNTERSSRMDLLNRIRCQNCTSKSLVTIIGAAIGQKVTPAWLFPRFLVCSIDLTLVNRCHLFRILRWTSDVLATNGKFSFQRSSSLFRWWLSRTRRYQLCAHSSLIRFFSSMSPTWRTARHRLHSFYSQARRSVVSVVERLLQALWMFDWMLSFNLSKWHRSFD
jgi:hypothetical protein